MEKPFKPHTLQPLYAYNRMKAVHLGWNGDLGKEWTYWKKRSYNKTFGTPFKPIVDILENFSTFAEFKYIPCRWSSWSFCASAAFDTGGIYGDNWKFQMKIDKYF